MSLLPRWVSATPPLSTRACLQPVPCSTESTMRAAARPPVRGQVAARRRHRLLHRSSAEVVDGQTPRTVTPSLLLYHPFQLLSHPTLILIPYPPIPVPLCSLDGVSGRICSPHLGTPPTLPLSGGASTGASPPPGRAAVADCRRTANPVGTRPYGWTVLPDVAGELVLLHLSPSLPTLILLSCLTTRGPSYNARSGSLPPIWTIQIPPPD